MPNPNPTPSPPLQNTRFATLSPVRDPWPRARQRFQDIADTPFSRDFARTFSYANARVVFSYDAAPSTAFLGGRIGARGLKPNFAYQIKLAGKPVSGSRGWGGAGDDWSNEQLGRAGRWWNDSNFSTGTNISDALFEQKYRDAPAAQRETVYGYLFLGNIVTDQNGSADLIVMGDKSYHITWQDKQSGAKDVLAGNYRVQNAAPLYGYAAPIPTQSVRLWHELEAERAQPIVLPRGNYNCRLLLTEETFHNSDPQNQGGFWPTVLGTEDLDGAGKPDLRTENDVRFRIGGQ